MVLAEKRKVNRYIPDFPAMMRLYEVNYAQLSRLIPRQQQVGQVISYQIGISEYQLSIEEQTRYTTLVKIQQTLPNVSYWSLPELIVRLYHDALIAEVCACQQIFRFKAIYDYPNARMHQRDEKYQINQFLASWLSYCFKHGIIKVSLS